jgi:predicted naringenin-chalcone synthase
MPQEQLCRFMESVLTLDRKERLMFRKIFSSSGIEKRHFVVDDFSKQKGEYSFFENSDTLDPAPQVSKRMQLYQQHALQLSIDAVNDCLWSIGFDKKKITHIVTFSCTGMYAPGLDVELVETMKLDPHVERTCINFMGCYAAFNALKSAYHIVRSEPGANVLLVGVELCSLHYINNNVPDQVIANAIFADGASAVLVSADEELLSNPRTKLELNKFYSEFAYAGKDEMVWSIGDFGFTLRLSSYVPDMIRQGIKELTEKLFKRCGVSAEEVSYYAIHPGGMKILQACEEALQITREHNAVSYDVLKNYGNMSSVTVLFVLKQYMQSLNMGDKGKNMLSCAFGPGLTMESMLLKVA